jgi:hypothetical protein
MKLKIIQIEWKDITCPSDNTWFDVTGKEDIKYKASKCLTVGFLVKKTKKVIITAQNYGKDYDGGEQWGGLEIIPRGTISKVKTLGYYNDC